MPVKMTREQYAALKKGAGAERTGSSRATRRREDLPENQLEKQICDFLRIRRWQVRRNHVGLFVPYRVAMELMAGRKPAGHVYKLTPIRINEPGTADWFAVRCGPKQRVEFFWFECKASGKPPTVKQVRWLWDQNLMALFAEWFDGFEGEAAHDFVRWYGERFE